MLNGQIISDSELSGKLIKNEELFNHEYLYNRNAADAHPIQAITGLKEKLAELENKAPAEFKSIKAEISRLITNIINESTRAQASEKQIQAEVNSLAKALLAVQNDEELEKLALDIIKLKTENLELKNELVEAINKVSEGLVEQISLLQDLSDAVDTRVTDLTKADIDLKEMFSEKFINTETFISTNMNAIIEIEQRVANQETALAELKTELEALNSSPEAPSSDFLDSLIKTFVTTEDIVTIEQNIASLKNRITDLESSINGEDGILSRLDILETRATVVNTIAENIQSLSGDISSSKIKIAINEDHIKALKEKIQNIQVDTDNNTANILTVENEIESVKTITESLEKSINTNKVNIEELSSAQDRLSELHTDITKLRSELTLKIQSESALLDISLDKVTDYITTLNTSILPEIQKDIQELAVELADVKVSTEEAYNLAKQSAESITKLQDNFKGSLNNLHVYVNQKADEATQKILDAGLSQQEVIDEIKQGIQKLEKSDKDFSTSMDAITGVVEKHSLDVDLLKTLIGNSTMPGTLSYQAGQNSIDISINRGKINQLFDKINDLLAKDVSTDRAILSMQNTNTTQNIKLTDLENILTELRVNIFGEEGIDTNIKDLQSQINNMSSVFRFVGIVDTTSTEVAANGKPKYLKLNSASPSNRITLRDSIYDRNNPYVAQPGDVVLVELFDKQSSPPVSLGYTEFVFVHTPTYQDWEELGNMHSLDTQLQHHIEKAISDNNNYKAAVDKQLDDLREDITHHIIKDFEVRSLIFPSKEAAEMYAHGMDPDRFPTPGGTASGGNLEYTPTNAYPGLIVTVATNDLYESYIIKEDCSLTLISGGGGSGGSPDIGTDYQYCFRANTELDTSFTAIDNGGFVDGYVAVSIEKPTRKNNVLQIAASLTDGGDYIYYLSTISNLKFTCNGFYAPFINLGQLTQALNGINYTLYRSSRKITVDIELVIN